jgi:hypothetical protein
VSWKQGIVPCFSQAEHSSTDLQNNEDHPHYQVHQSTLLMLILVILNEMAVIEVGPQTDYWLKEHPISIYTKME